MEERLAAELDGFARDQLEAYFLAHGLPRPTDIKTRTRAGFREEGGVVKVSEVDLAVELVTDQPSPVIREARQTVARALNASGYRLETLDGVVDSRPLALLTLSATEPEPGILKRNSTKEYLVFAAIVGGLAASLAMLLALLVRPFRRKRKVYVQQMARTLADLQQAQQVDGLPDIPVVAMDLPPPPPPPLVEDPEAVALRQMPFDQVLDVLIAAEPARRKALIDRLDLNPPLRKRLEQELLS